MSENEAKDTLRVIGWNRAEEGDIEGCEAIDIAMNALEEIQQYRAIGTVEDIEKGIKQSEEEFEMLMEYRNIGTIEECRTAVERMKPKKPRFYAHDYYCSECGNLVGNDEFEWKRFLYCDKCGTKIDWS